MRSLGVRGRVSLLQSGRLETVRAFRWTSELGIGRDPGDPMPTTLFFLKDEEIEHQREGVPIGQV